MTTETTLPAPRPPPPNLRPPGEPRPPAPPRPWPRRPDPPPARRAPPACPAAALARPAHRDTGAAHCAGAGAAGRTAVPDLAVLGHPDAFRAGRLHRLFPRPRG